MMAEKLILFLELALGLNVPSTVQSPKEEEGGRERERRFQKV